VTQTVRMGARVVAGSRDRVRAGAGPLVRQATHGWRGSTGRYREI
jgi:hypothetical protein